MNYEYYADFTFSDDLSEFKFISIGKNGQARKGVIFMPMGDSDVYNLAFGDLKENGEIDDFAISNNGDRNKILGTIAWIVELYTNRYPDRIIRFTGSTSARTRLYRMAISVNLEKLSEKYEIYMKLDDKPVPQPFQKNLHASSFFIKRKI